MRSPRTSGVLNKNGSIRTFLIDKKNGFSLTKLVLWIESNACSMYGARKVDEDNDVAVAICSKVAQIQ